MSDSIEESALRCFYISGLATSSLLDFSITTNNGPTFLASGGTVRIDSISATSLKITLINARYTGTIATNTAGKGCFLLNGSPMIPSA